MLGVVGEEISHQMSFEANTRAPFPLPTTHRTPPRFSLLILLSSTFSSAIPLRLWRPSGKKCPRSRRLFGPLTLPCHRHQLLIGEERRRDPQGTNESGEPQVGVRDTQARASGPGEEPRMPFPPAHQAAPSQPVWHSGERRARGGRSKLLRGTRKRRPYRR